MQLPVGIVAGVSLEQARVLCGQPLQVLDLRPSAIGRVIRSILLRTRRGLRLNVTVKVLLLTRYLCCHEFAELPVRPVDRLLREQSVLENEQLLFPGCCAARLFALARHLVVQHRARLSCVAAQKRHLLPEFRQPRCHARLICVHVLLREF